MLTFKTPDGRAAIILEEKEAKVVYAVCQMIVGDTSGPRGMFDALGCKLHEMGFNVEDVSAYVETGHEVYKGILLRD